MLVHSGFKTVQIFGMVNCGICGICVVFFVTFRVTFFYLLPRMATLVYDGITHIMSVISLEYQDVSMC